MVMDSQNAIFDKHILVVGCGGLGLYVIEYLVRIGAKHLTIVDGDIFSLSNLNRQLYCDKSNIGISKAETALNRVKCINPEAEVTAFKKMLDHDNADAIFRDIDIAFDCTDNAETKVLMEDTAIKHKVMLVHGAINGLLGQVTVIKGQKILSQLFMAKTARTQRTLSFVPAIVAGIQVNEAIKAILGKKDALVDGRVMLIDLETNSFEVVQF